MCRHEVSQGVGAGVVGGLNPDRSGGQSTPEVLSGSLPVKEVEPEVVGKLVVEEEIIAGDYVLAQQEMVVEEGVLESHKVQLVGSYVVVVAERVASFLLLLDGRLPADSHIFIDKEASWLLNSMDLKPVGIQYTSVEALLDGS